MDGKLTDVIIEDSPSGLTVWADAGTKDIISSVPGVAWCMTILNSVEYTVHLDPRYDVEWIKQEIIARVKIGSR